MTDYAPLLKNLDDAQLLDLLKIILQEGSSRKLEREFKDVALDEEELANITQTAYQQEYNRQISIQKDLAVAKAKEKAASDVAAKFGIETPSAHKSNEQILWEEYKSIETAIKTIGITNIDRSWNLNVWSRKDKRIYINDHNNAAIITYWDTGTDTKPPQSISFTKDAKLHFIDKTLSAKQKKQLTQLFSKICSFWNTLSINSETIAEFGGDPEPKSLAKYLASIELKTKTA